MSEDNKSLFFMVLSLGCVWLLLDNVYGNKYLTLALSKLFDFMDSSTNTTSLYESNDNIKNVVDKLNGGKDPLKYHDPDITNEGVDNFEIKNPNSNFQQHFNNNNNFKG